MFRFLKCMTLVVLICARPSIGQYEPKCMVRVSICNGNPQCPIQNADFFMQATGYLDKVEYDPGRYTVFYTCSNFLSRMYMIAPGCPVAYTTVAHIGTGHSKLIYDCSGECAANPPTFKVTVDFSSSCGGDLSGLGVSPESDIKNIKFLNNGSVCLESQRLPLNVKIHHPDHATTPFTLTSVPSLVQLACRVDGGWAAWLEGPCSRSCDTGIRNRTRLCDQPAAANGGQPCVGETFIMELCNPQPCPRNGGWSEWFYTPCTVSCGGGTRSRIRECNNPSVANGGLECPGDAILVENEACNGETCPIDGGPGTWMDWSVCSCNAPQGNAPAQSRRRTCSNPAPEFGGAPCSPDTLVQYVPCNLGTQCFFCTTGCCSGSSYQLLPDQGRVFVSKIACERLGGKLIEINCPGEKLVIDQLIAAVANQAEQIWLGMVRIDGQLVYMSTNEPVLYLEWAPNEPNFNGDCFELINPTFLWRDAICNLHEEQTVCEFTN